MINDNYLKKFEGGKALIEFYGKREQRLISGKIEEVVIECLGLKVSVSEIMVCENCRDNPKKWIKSNLKPKDFYHINFETADIFEKDDSISIESYQQGIDVVLSIPQN